MSTVGKKLDPKITVTQTKVQVQEQPGVVTSDPASSTAISQRRDAHRGNEIEGLWRHGIDGYAKVKYVNQNVPVPPWDPRAERAP